MLGHRVKTGNKVSNGSFIDINNTPGTEQIKRKLVQHSDSLVLILCVQVSDYVWQTYKEVYATVTDIGSAMRSCGVKPVIYLFRRQEKNHSLYA